MDGPVAEKRRGRRWLQWTLGIVALVVAIPVCWLASHLLPRDGHFLRRAAPIQSVQTQPEVAHPGNFVSQAVRITTQKGLVVDMRVLRPAGVKGPLPLVVLLGGQRTGRDAVDAVGDPGAMVVAALDYPYHGEERITGIYRSLASVPAMQQGLLDTPPAVFAAVDWLAQQPWVDPKQMEVMGLSLGVPFAAVAGALDPRLRRVWLVHGRVGNRAWIANRLEESIPNRFLRHTAAALVNLLAHGATFRTEKWVPKIAPRRVVVVGATEDEQMSRPSVEALYAAAGEPKEMLWSNGPHVRPRRPEVVQQILRMVQERLSFSAARKN
jgi:dienelactone hydrolase